MKNIISKSININREIKNIEQDAKKSSVTNILLMLDFIKNRNRIYKDGKISDLHEIKTDEKIMLIMPYIFLTMIEFIILVNGNFLNSLLYGHFNAYISLVFYFSIMIISSYFTLKSIFMHFNKEYLGKGLIWHNGGVEVEIETDIHPCYLTDYEKRKILKTVKKNENLIAQKDNEAIPQRKRL